MPEDAKDFVRLPLPNVLLDEHNLLVVNKPGGLLTQGPPGIDSLELRIKRWRALPATSKQKNYLGVPHRLDRPAAGVMLFSTDKATTKKLSKQFEERKIRKTYWALVEGQVQADSGEWVDSMRKIPGEARSEIVAAHHESAQQAVLAYRVLNRSETHTHLEINLKTGRTHQIRLQAASHGHPILGDQLYGSPVEFGPQTSDLRLRWIALLARRIELTHPNTKAAIDICVEPAFEQQSPAQEW